MQLGKLAKTAQEMYEDWRSANKEPGYAIPAWSLLPPHAKATWEERFEFFKKYQRI